MTIRLLLVGVYTFSPKQQEHPNIKTKKMAAQKAKGVWKKLMIIAQPTRLMAHGVDLEETTDGNPKDITYNQMSNYKMYHNNRETQ